MTSIDSGEVMEQITYTLSAQRSDEVHDQIQLVPKDRWSLKTGGPLRQVVPKDRFVPTAHLLGLFLQFSVQQHKPFHKK